jgi:hypothetical protein
MTKKDYIAIAAALNRFYKTSPLDEHKMPEAPILDVANALGDIMETDNPRFDRDRFINAITKE